VYRFRIPFALAGVLVVAVGCSGSCGKADEKVSVAKATPEGRKLEPLPAPPQISVIAERNTGAFKVIAARPRGEVRAEVRPTITFTKPVVALGAVEAEAQRAQVARIEPSLEGEWKWLGSASVEFVPKDPVPFSTAFKVTVPKGLKALDGSVLEEDFVYEFQTPTLALQSVSPAAGNRWIKPNETFRLLFNQPVKEEALAAAASFTVSGDATPWKVKVLSHLSIAEERRQLREKALKEGKEAPLTYEDRQASKNRQVRYEIAAEKPFPLDASVKLSINPPLHGEQGPLPLAQPVELAFRTYGPLKLLSAGVCYPGQDRCPRGPLMLYSSNKLDVESLKGKVQIRPEVKIDWERVEAWAPEGGTETVAPFVALPGNFKPGTAYDVRIAQGVQDVFKQTAPTALAAKVKTTDLSSQLRVGAPVALIEAASGAKLPVEVVNLKTLDVDLWTLSTSEVAVLLSQSLYGSGPLISRPPDVTAPTQLKYAWNESRVHGLDLSPVLPKGKGLAYVVLNSADLGKDRPKNGFPAMVQVTDLAVHVKFSPKKSLAWVTRLSNGEAVGGADVSLYDRTGAVLWSGQTDGQGLVDMPGATALKLPAPINSWDRPYVLVAATSGEDTGVTADTWNSGLEPFYFDSIEQGWEGAQPQSSGFVFTERGIYRPGDTVYVKGVARYRQVGELRQPAAGTALKFSVVNSRGEKVKEEPVKLSRFGTFSAEVLIPKDSPTGYFSLAAEGQAPGGPIALGGSFRVEEYRAPQFRVDVTANQTSILAGEPLAAQVSARYLFGGAMSDAKVKWNVNSESTTFTAESAPGFQFEQETWWYDDGRPRPSGGFFASGEGQVDAQGLFSLKSGETQAPGEKPYTYTVEAEVTDVSRQAVANRATVTVHPSAYYVGLKGPQGFPKAGDDVSLEALVVSPEGKRVGGRKFEVAITQRTWKSVRQKEAGGGFATVSEPVEEKVSSCALESRADASAPCTFKPPQPGFYIARATILDEKQRKHIASLGVYAVGSGFVAWQREDTHRISLLADKTTYAVGDVAKVLIKSPWEKAGGLLTVEREGVLDRRPLSLSGSAVTVEIPITEEMVPNVFASVLLMRPRVSAGKDSGDDPGRPQAAVGYVKLSVERKTKRLSVSVKTDKEEYRPGQEVAISLDVKDAAGKPAPAEVTVFAVDEAVLQLTHYQTPDPIASIFPDRPLSVLLGEPLIHLVRRRSFG